MCGDAARQSGTIGGLHTRERKSMRRRTSNASLKIKRAAIEALEERRLLTIPVVTAITVNTFTNVVDGNTDSLSLLNTSPGADGKISLREAILAADNTAAPSTINLTHGTYT